MPENDEKNIPPDYTEEKQECKKNNSCNYTNTL
jgi:hypothetical protein